MSDAMFTTKYSHINVIEALILMGVRDYHENPTDSFALCRHTQQFAADLLDVSHWVTGNLLHLRMNEIMATWPEKYKGVDVGRVDSAYYPIGGQEEFQMNRGEHTNQLERRLKLALYIANMLTSERNLVTFEALKLGFILVVSKGKYLLMSRDTGYGVAEFTSLYKAEQYLIDLRDEQQGEVE